MNHKIYIIEGPDAVGKSTLAAELARVTKGSIIHASYNPKWNILEYHDAIIKAARFLSRWQPVILDRWVPSEYVYGTVFRGKPSFNTKEVIENNNKVGDLVWIYCRNDKAVENHAAIKLKRKEMYNDISEVVDLYDQYVTKLGPELPWHFYEYNKVSTKAFIKEVTK